jgi:hypothetical protein
MNWRALTAVVVVIVAGGTAAGLIRDSRINTDFPAIRARSTEAAVRQLMGEPKQIQKTCTVFDTSVTPDCDHVFIYKSIFAPMKSKYWLVFFDQNNQVTATSSELEP